jgi:hypothetical protein
MTYSQLYKMMRIAKTLEVSSAQALTERSVADGLDAVKKFKTVLRENKDNIVDWFESTADAAWERWGETDCKAFFPWLF